MVFWSYPPTQKQLYISAFVFITGASLIVVGPRLSLTNIAPQEETTKARRDFVKQRLRKLLQED